MFEKLLANLPYNSELIKQVGFYTRRLRHEETIRRTGMIFMVLAFTVQFFAFMSPPQQTTAYSTSDMINGGIKSKEDAVSACRTNTKNYKDVLWNFGISCENVARTYATTFRSTDHDERIYTFGWLPYGQTNPRSGKKTDETPYNLTKVSDTIYARKLRSFDTLPVSTYKVLKGVNEQGKTFYIMFDCGNIAFAGLPQPIKRCAYNNDLSANSKQCFERCPVSGLGDLPKNSSKCFKPCPYNKQVPANTPGCYVPCTYNKNLPANSPRCLPCDGGSTTNPAACISQRKTASNITQNIANADGSTAQPGDVISYTLYAENRGKTTVKAFTMQENLSDVLDYADVVDLDGGTLSKTNTVSWKARDIAAKSTLTHTLTVRVKNTIPMNTPPASDPSHYDRIMTNVYGNTVNINVPPAEGQPIVTASEELPKAGPGESLLLAGALVVVAGYFFARTRLLVNESVVVMQQTNSGSL